jgi:hypothetical protein
MIGLLSNDKELRDSLSLKTNTVSIHKSFPNVDGVFIDWLRTDNKKKPSKEFVHQAATVNYYAKKNIPIVIYDRHMYIDNVEYKWLRKISSVFLFEPALNNRKGFEYMPYWIDMSDERILNTSFNRSVDMAYIGNRNIKCFQKYYIDFIKKYPDRNVVFQDDNVEWSNVKYVIAISDEMSYNMGHLTVNVRDALNKGCMVLCPIENKYYVGMFHPYIVSNIDDCEYLLKICSDEMITASVLSLYQDIREGFPEFSLNHTVNRILECFNK